MKCLGDNGKVYHCKILLLDGVELIQEVQSSTTGQQLLEVVFKHLNLVETVYFGLRYLDNIGQTHWLEPNKKVFRQLKGNNALTLYFGVKFYASDPCKLVEEITRYQFFLQVKQDVFQGRLPVHFDLSAELAAYAVQSELGDYDQRRHSVGYVSEFHFVATQSEDLENKIADIHKTLSGQVPAVAELNYLEKVKWLDMYGVDLHPVLGEDNIEYFLGLTPSGVIVLRNKTKVGNYFWPRITKVYFKGRFFMLRVRDKHSDESTYGFELPTKQACKHLWKCCVEHHAFFRLMQVGQTPVTGMLRLTSKFRHNMHTAGSVQDGVTVQRLPPQVMRVPSQRGLRRIPPTDGIDSSLRDELPKNSSGNPLSLGPANMQRSSSVPIVLPLSDSPRSTRSAPWGSVKQKGLYSSSTNPSPRSVRSTSSKHSRMRTARQSSVDSESSYDGRHLRRSNQHHANVEYPKYSRGSHQRSKKSRSNSRNRDSGSESESHHKRHRSRQRTSNGKDELVQCEPLSGHHTQSAHIKELNARRSGYMNSGMESESEANYRQKRRHRRHGRSRSRSPSDSQKRPPDELKQHFEFELVESTGMSEEQLKNIPYTKVEIGSKPFKIKYSPNLHHQQPKSIKSSNSSPILPNVMDDPGSLANYSYSPAHHLPSRTSNNGYSIRPPPNHRAYSAGYPTSVISLPMTPGDVNQLRDGMMVQTLSSKELNHEMSTEL